ncbi:TetR/AcrR family transcriptional regulator [Sphingomonas montanisoli]|uniref:TetR family transcriptional regulator n=1 Tax=Sphingomonas montanisoli TaxID=2606412 RepID=A0A5D9C2K7_9SPHN|nr:TetR family transcriptional regulator [Sphingomonas montanisoli]TZG25816.1 TetR family transcriptional regulator [Sphingomonas montanisoli]
MTTRFKPSQIKLILTGERLFSEQGVDGVPLREIALAAGQANNTAVHYHFGSREGLIAAISAYRIAELDRVRGRMLADLARQAKPADLRELLKVLFLSQLEIADDRGCHPYAHFMVQYLTRHRPSGTRHASDMRDGDSQSLHALLDLIETRLPAIPARLVRQRLELLNLSFLAMLVRNDNARLFGGSCRSLATDAAEMIEMALGAISVPVAVSDG